MRALGYLAGFWVLLALGVVALLWLRARDEEGRPGRAPAPPSLTCEALDDRARQCRRELLDRAGDFVEQASLRAGRSGLTAGGRRLALTTLLDGAISKREVRRECEAHRTSRAPMIQRLWRELEHCWPKRGCAAFVSCLHQVAEAEERAGRLPL